MSDQLQITGRWSQKQIAEAFRSDYPKHVIIVRSENQEWYDTPILDDERVVRRYFSPFGIPANKLDEALRAICMVGGLEVLILRPFVVDGVTCVDAARASVG